MRVAENNLPSTNNRHTKLPTMPAIIHCVDLVSVKRAVRLSVSESCEVKAVKERGGGGNCQF